MSTHDLQTIIDQSKGRIELDPTDVFDATKPVKVVDREIELYGHWFELDRTVAVKKQSAPQVVLRNVSGVVEGINVVGRKNPTQGYVPSVEGHAGFWLMGCTDLRIHAAVRHVPGDFVYLGALKGGTKKHGDLWTKPCSGIVLDIVGDDCGRHAIAAVGVRNREPVTYDVLFRQGLTIRETSVFSNYRRMAIDRENMGGGGTRPRDIDDQGALWVRRTA